jgi:hypothetical protein
MDIVKFEAVEKRILDVRGEKVILDSDVAELYGVETKRVNEAVKNNPDKFPEGYIIALNKKEWDGLKSKFSTSIKGGKVKLPSTFTEKGLYMLATTCPVKCAAPRRGFNQGTEKSACRPDHYRYYRDFCQDQKSIKKYQAIVSRPG